MSEYLIQDTTLDAIANAINAKTGGSSAMTPAEMVTAIGSIPGGTTITDGIVVKARDANGYATEIDIYGDTIYHDTVSGNPAYADRYNGYWLSSIHAVNKPKTVKSYAFRFNGGANYPVTISGLENVEYVGGYAFFSDSGQGGAGIKPVNFTDLDFSKITAINEYCFYGTNLSGDIVIRQDCQAPERWPAFMFYKTKISSINCAAPFRFNGQNFKNCALLETAVLSRAVTINTQEFMGCTSLKTVVLGSVGYEVAVVSNSVFSGCTQSDLTITVFSKGADVDGKVTAIRNGATNATIIIKASEATTYNGTSYAAGDTILTSEVTA